MQRARIANVSLCIGLLLSCAIFYLFSYNSGYGYDALEYLVIGRSMAEGMPLYTYLPSKSPAIYYLVAGLYKLGVNFDHGSLAAVITVLYAITVLLTYCVASRWLSRSAAIAVTCLTGAAAFFTELNFLQPTALFYLCGLVAFDALLRFDSSRNDWALFVAGLALGLGIVVKSSAAFYGLAAGSFLIFLSMREQRSWAWLLQTQIVLGAGALSVLIAVTGYYWSQGNAHAFIDWTFAFPFAHYPSSTTYIAKAYTKLLWVNAFILVAALSLLDARIRAFAFGSKPAVLALLFGGCAYLALLKTQASHYFFPGAPFLFMFSVLVYEFQFRTFSISRRFKIASVALVGCACAVVTLSIAMYRPDAVRRLATIKDFAAEEQPIREFVQSRVPDDRYLLITGGSLVSTWTYWITHRYPPPPFINADVKTIWMLRNQPREVFRALEHPLLTLVQFDPAQLSKPVLEDVFGNLPQDREIMRQYYEHVKRRFIPVENSIVPASFWSRSDPFLAGTPITKISFEEDTPQTARRSP